MSVEINEEPLGPSALAEYARSSARPSGGQRRAAAAG
jgi:hypothetical protein